MRLGFAAVVALVVCEPAAAATKLIAGATLEQKVKATFGDASTRTWSESDVLLTLVGRTKPVTNAFVNSEALAKALGDYVQVDDLRLASRSLCLPEGKRYDFSQFVAGRRVENATLTVDVTRADEIIGLTNRTVPDLKLFTPEPLMSGEAARCFAAASFLRVPANCDVNPPAMPEGLDTLTLEAEQTLYAVPPFARWAWGVELRSQSPLASRRYVIDAKGGAVLAMADRIHHASPKGRVFVPSPLTDAEVKDHRNVVLRTGGKAFPPYKDVELQRLDQPKPGEPYRLQGKWVRIEDFVRDSTFANEIPEKLEGDFLFERGTSESGFASVMAYHHIDSMQEYVRSLGIDCMAARSISVDVRFSSSYDEPVYINERDGKGKILFGYSHDRGRLFYAEDADVIAHEYAHALHASVATDRYDDADEEGAAVFEGFADYWAMTMFADVKMAHGLDPACQGQWIYSATGASGCTRRVNLAATRRDFSKDVGPHQNATVWTALLWALRQQLTAPVADKLILVSHVSTPARPDFEAVSRALFTADQRLYRGANRAQICTVLTAREMIDPKACPPASAGP